MKRGLASIGAVVMLLTAAGCASDVSRDSLANKFRKSGFSAEEARCVSARVFEEFEQEAINEVDRASKLADLDRSTRDQINAIASECDVPRGERR